MQDLRRNPATVQWHEFALNQIAIASGYLGNSLPQVSPLAAQTHTAARRRISAQIPSTWADSALANMRKISISFFPFIRVKSKFY